MLTVNKWKRKVNGDIVNLNDHCKHGETGSQHPTLKSLHFLMQQRCERMNVTQS